MQSIIVADIASQVSQAIIKCSSPRRLLQVYIRVNLVCWPAQSQKGLSVWGSATTEYILFLILLMTMTH